MNSWKCKDGCSECCGPVPIPKVLAKSFENKAQRKVIDIIEIKDEIIPITEDMKCVFLNKEGKCEIYEYRPKICRDYGTTNELPCPYVNCLGVLRNPRQVQKVKKRIDNLVDNFESKLKHFDYKLKM